ncbi:MAG: hypothetical protein HC880_05090 [Bacteroidia bacterium]|nr:hypothetical protein [Bacteroidia bacterium]
MTLTTKLVSPEGITENHYMKPGTCLEYTLRFQNTGTAEAINVRGVDTLSTFQNYVFPSPSTLLDPCKLISKAQAGPALSTCENDRALS